MTTAPVLRVMDHLNIAIVTNDQAGERKICAAVNLVQRFGEPADRNETQVLALSWDEFLAETVTVAKRLQELQKSATADLLTRLH